MRESVKFCNPHAAILNLVWIEGKTHIPSAFKFGVDGIFDRVTRRATPLSKCRSSYYFSLLGTSSGTPASSRDCFSKYLNQYMEIFIWTWQHKGLSLEDKVYLLKKTIADSADYKQNYDQIKARPLDINTKGEFPTKV